MTSHYPVIQELLSEKITVTEQKCCRDAGVDVPTRDPTKSFIDPMMRHGEFSSHGYRAFEMAVKRLTEMVKTDNSTEKHSAGVSDFMNSKWGYELGRSVLHNLKLGKSVSASVDAAIAKHSEMGLDTQTARELGLSAGASWLSTLLNYFEDSATRERA